VLPACKTHNAIPQVDRMPIFKDYFPDSGRRNFQANLKL